MLNKKEIREEMERDGIIELSMEYGLDITCFNTDLYFKGVRKAMSIKQRIQRRKEFYWGLSFVKWGWNKESVFSITRNFQRWVKW